MAANRGVATLPRWLVEEHAIDFAIYPVRLGKSGIHKNIYLGMRTSDGANPNICRLEALASSGQ